MERRELWETKDEVTKVLTAVIPVVVSMTGVVDVIVVSLTGVVDVVVVVWITGGGAVVVPF